MTCSRCARIAGILAIAALVASCAATQSPAGIARAGPAAPGFLLGLWHGLIAPIAFLVSLFSEHIRIYAVPNAGRWYDFGFMLGIGGFSGGLFAGSRARRAASVRNPEVRPGAE
jgi:hypothetical protein